MVIVFDALDLFSKQPTYLHATAPDFVNITVCMSRRILILKLGQVQREYSHLNTIALSRALEVGRSWTSVQDKNKTEKGGG